MKIEIRGLRKSFGASPALHGVDLDIASGELIGLLGPSGSGKTTLLRAIAGLEVPNEGSIRLGDQDTAGQSIQERRVGFVFQNYALFRHMTVSDNIAYGLRARRRAERPSGPEIERRVSELLELVRLSGFGERYPTQLSGGQRQRVALARALAVEPRVLLLDEPFGALDAQVRKDLRRWLREIHLQTGHTTVFVTHDQDEALEMSDRVAVLNAGRIEQIGTPDEVYDRPASPFVYGFIGDSNKVPVDIANGVVRIGDSVLGRTTASAERQGHIYFRPEHARIEEPASLPRGTVVNLRRVGSKRRIDLRLDTAGDLIEIDLPAGSDVKQSDRLGLRIERFCLFAEAKRLPILDVRSCAA